MKKILISGTEDIPIYKILFDDKSIIRLYIHYLNFTIH